MQEKQYLLIFTDGYQIKTQKYRNFEFAKRSMDEEYKTHLPEQLSEDCAELTFCDTHEAQIYANGENVFLWKLIPVY